MAAVTIEQIAAELRGLSPEELAVIQGFVGYLRDKLTPAEAVELAEATMADYLSGLEDYEDRLARGEIRWE